MPPARAQTLRERRCCPAPTARGCGDSNRPRCLRTGATCWTRSCESCCCAVTCCMRLPSRRARSARAPAAAGPAQRGGGAADGGVCVPGVHGAAAPGAGARPVGAGVVASAMCWLLATLSPGPAERPGSCPAETVHTSLCFRIWFTHTHERAPAQAHARASVSPGRRCLRALRWRTWRRGAASRRRCWPRRCCSAWRTCTTCASTWCTRAARCGLRCAWHAPGPYPRPAPSHERAHLHHPLCALRPALGVAHACTVPSALSYLCACALLNPRCELPRALGMASAPPAPPAHPAW